MYLKHRSFCCVGEVYVSLNTKRVEKTPRFNFKGENCKGRNKTFVVRKKEMFTKHNNL